MVLRPLACWDCRFEPYQSHGYLSLVSVVCRQVEFSAMCPSLVRRIPTECAVCNWVRTGNFEEEEDKPSRNVEPWIKELYLNKWHTHTIKSNTIFDINTSTRLHFKILVSFSTSLAKLMKASLLQKSPTII